MKRVFIVHGWSGYPSEGWFPWIKKELEKRKFKVFVPRMPNADKPKRTAWIPYLRKLVKNPDKDTYFIGHSIGCQTILRYLQSLQKEAKVGGCVFVAGWVNLTVWEGRTKEETKIANHWIKAPLKFNKIKKHTKKFVAIFSDDDPYVPKGNINVYKERLGAKIILEHNKGHIGGEHNIKKLPSALKGVLRMTKQN